MCRNNDIRATWQHILRFVSWNVDVARITTRGGEREEVVGMAREGVGKGRSVEGGGWDRQRARGRGQAGRGGRAGNCKGGIEW